MNERWAVAFGTATHLKDMFVWARTADGELAVFERKTDALKWVLAFRDDLRKKGDAVFIKISSK